MAIINFKNRTTTGFDEDALFTFTDGEQVINFGRLTTTGDLAEGIFAAADDVTVRNFGKVETNGLGAVGILVVGDDPRIENYGSVTTRGGHFNFEFFSEGILAVGDRFRIANYGTVRVEGEFSSGVVGVGADGVVVNYGRVDCFSSSGVVGAVGVNSKAINAGQIASHGVDSTALFALDEGGVALNLGRIQLDGDASLAMRGTFAGTQVVNAGTISICADDCVGMLGIGDAHQLSNSGVIEVHGSSSSGMGAGSGTPGSTGSDLEIVNAGRISTDGDLSFGIFLGVTPFEYRPTFDGVVANRGTIETAGDGAAGVFVVGDGCHITNSGRISTDGGVFDNGPLGLVSAAGIIVSGDGALIENTKCGVVRSDNAASAAVELNVQEFAGVPAADLAARLENSGLIRGIGLAVLGGAGEETVINHGRIVGDVVLGDGDDTYEAGKGGSLAGDLVLGGGDDLALIANGCGTLRIADFEAGAGGGDVLDVSAFFSDFGDVISHAFQQGANTVIALDHNDRVVLENTLLGALNAGDFQLA